MKGRISILAVAFFLLALFIAQISSAEMAEVKVGKGTLKVGGILQAGFTYHLEDEEGFDSFTLNRARFLFWGTIVPDKVKYFVQTETKGDFSILDYKAQFFYIPRTEITVGRFLPNFTVYMPYSTAKLEMINYPLTTLRFAVWRQVGIQTTTKTDYVDFNLGIFNGYPANNFSDDNDAKDFFGRVEFKPPVEKANVTIGGYVWMGKALPTFSKSWTDIIVVNTDTVFQSRTFSKSFPEETLEWNRFGGFAKLDYQASEQVTVRFRGEFLTASTEYLTDAHEDSVASKDAQAFFAHLGVQPSPKVEFLARYDFHDPNTDLDYVKDESDDDEEAWLTLGLNYYLEGLNAMFYLNYIHKMEPGQENVWDSDTETFITEDREIDNDLIQAQVQILF